MNGSNRLRNYVLTVTLAVVALGLAIAWPVATVTAVETPGDNGPIPVVPGGNGQPTATPTPSPTATSVIPLQPTDSRPDAPDPGDNEGGLTNGQTPTPTRTSSGSGGTPTPTPKLSEHERINALARNKIIFHDATPIQLCRVEEGLQVYYIGRHGNTRLGPWVPPFSELAELYPDGEEASIYLGYNPLTGKRVKIDYLPHVHRIRVDTFYADRDGDRNKQYIFHFGPEHDITYDVW